MKRILFIHSNQQLLKLFFLFYFITIRHNCQILLVVHNHTTDYIWFSFNAPFFLLQTDSYHYCKTDWQGNNLALVVSDLPVFLSFRSFDSVNDHLKEIARLRFPAIINNWIDRQENPELAFYQYWTLSECLKDRNDPTVRIKIDDDDCLTVKGSSVLLRETFQFWTSEDWICTVQGPALTNLLYEVRKPGKTLQLLDEAFEKFGTE